MQLVKLKTAEVYRGKESELEEEFEEGREEEIAAEILDLMSEGAGLAEVKESGGRGGWRESRMLKERLWRQRLKGRSGRWRLRELWSR